MSTAVAESPVPKKGKKKLIIIAAAVAALLAVGGGVAVVMVKKSHAAAEQEAEDGDNAPAAPAKAAKHDPKAVPSFVPLDPFTVNLADRDAERYAQVAVTLEIGEAKLADQIKTYMPAIRNNVLLAIADKTAAQLMDRDGKRRLAAEIRRETARALGYDVPRTSDDDAEDGAKARRKGAKDDALPVRAVHFSNFIIQ